MALFDSFRKKDNDDKKSSNRQPVDEFTNNMMKSADAFAEGSADRYRGLDFSVKSLEVIDQYLEDLSDFYEELSDEQKQNYVGAIGSYVFETARRNFGGKYFWYDQLNQPILVTGQPEFETSILAFEKVKGRLVNGMEDNIPYYFAGYAERVKNKQSGMIV